jgi:hypothetical protein
VACLSVFEYVSVMVNWEEKEVRVCASMCPKKCECTDALSYIVFLAHLQRRERPGRTCPQCAVLRFLYDTAI